MSRIENVILVTYDRGSFFDPGWCWKVVNNHQPPGGHKTEAAKKKKRYSRSAG
jgi:hypothetical protein